MLTFDERVPPKAAPIPGRSLCFSYLPANNLQRTAHLDLSLALRCSTMALRFFDEFDAARDGSALAESLRAVPASDPFDFSLDNH